MNDIEVLNNQYESLVIYDEDTKKELVKITKDEIIIANSNLQVRLKPSQK